MRTILIVGCGDVARRAIPWLAGRFRVIAMIRDDSHRAALRALGARVLVADLDDRRTLRRLSGIADVVLHAAPPPRKGADDSRTRHLVAALAQGATVPRRLVYISTTGVYGDCHGAWVSETRPVSPDSDRAGRRVDAEQRLRAFGRRCGVSVGILRAPGIYAADRLPLARLERGDPILRPEDDVHTNHIHAEDLARWCAIAVFRGGAGRVWNACDNTRLTMGGYFNAVADHFGLPRPEPLSRTQIAERVSPLTLTFMQESRQIDNARIKRELRAPLMYPDIQSGLAAVSPAIH
ncbi:NAD(P)H-binding protein [Denitromonas halophila]|uniref:NAD-dependent epimerase/dehydratase family protein n=1 Tax=Denitromonas halophila TaxID=1629404 RepID=A0A557R2J9_9RHOO|nr:NAD(P)H-binding protein [Denitromonas halophila]TVO59383.1 NAD-dependent epimerase/dehydratase family protein [Denitromonas halophila]